MVEKKFEKIVRFFPAWEEKSSDPKKNYGIKSVEIGFYLKGSLGAIQFTLSTGWFLPQNKLAGCTDLYPMGIDVGFHSFVPRNGNDKPISESCEWLDGKPCYYDGSGLQAAEAMDLLISEGEETIWKLLENRYELWLEEKDDSN